MKIKKPLFAAAAAVLACLCLASSMAFAQAPARKAFGKGNPFQVEELPAGKLKNQLQTIPPQARDKAMKWLHTIDFSEFDAAEHLRVDHGGGVFIVCPDNHGNCEGHSHGPAKPEATNDSPGTTGTIAPEAAPTAEPPTANISVPASSPPAYNSRPGATRHIYLDFNGGIVTGTAWNNNPSYGNVASWNVKVWTQDADRTTFNEAEQTWMRQIWQRLAEDYAPFDVNVTTDVTYDPANYTGNKDFVGWLMICETTDNNGVTLPTSGVGGVAYVGVFGEATYSPTYQPAWVTSTNGGGSEDIVSEAASHEMGHNMGLSHDGTSSLGYYGGHVATASAPSWGPIMGTGYDCNVTQWSKGEYFAANMLQDDLSIMSARIPYRTDDHGDNITAATASTITNNVISQSGVIETTGDPDVFSFTTGVGNISFTANPYRCDADTWGGNLDIILELYDSSQTLIASSNPAAETTAFISTTVAAAGTYYLVLKPSAAGTPLVNSPSGYTVYGSLGQYTIGGTVQPFDPPLGLTGITPSSGNAGSSVTVDITGTKLSANTSVKLKKAGRANIAGTSVQMIGGTLRCQFNLAGAASGAWDVVATNPDLATSTLSAAFTVNGTLVSLWSGNFDGTVTGWISQPVSGTANTWDIVTTASQSPNKSYFADGPSSTSVTHLISPQIPIPADSTNLQVEFWHRYNLQSGRDGGRLSFSLDGGAWFDVTSSNSGAAFTLNGYNTAMATTGQTGPFAGQQAWSGTTSSVFVRTAVNLNDIPKYAGKNLRLRWEIATNNQTASAGWYVDSVSLLGDSTPPNQPPVITVAAGTSSSETQMVGPTTYQIIRGVGTDLSVTATDDASESDLTYTWQSTGPAPVVFPVNGNNAAKNSTATFSAVGDYVLTVNATDTGTLSTPSGVNVRVIATDSLVITPGSGNPTVGNTLQFSAAVRDQFGNLLASQPSPVNWSTNGGGSINSSGLFTATTAGGPFTITATSGSYSATASVTVNPAPATVQLTNLNQTYTGSSKAVTVTTTPAGLANSVTYNGLSIEPTNAATYTVVATITNPNYVGSASGSLVIAKAPQTINFGPLADVPDNAAPFALTATATSGLTVSCASSNTAVATVSGSTVTIVGLGTTTLTASQAGNSNYNSAISVPQTLTVVRANPLAVSGGPYKVLIGQSLSLNGSASQPSFGESITTHEWDLNNDNTFGDVTGATPPAISFATLTDTWGMLQGLNTIKLKVTDSASKTSIVSTTVELVLSLTWDANGASANRTDGGGAWIGMGTLWWDGASNVNWASGSNVTFGNAGTGGAVTLASPTSVNNITFNPFSGTYTLGTAGQALTINGGITKNAGAGLVSMTSPLILGAAQTWANNSATAVNLTNMLDNGGFILTAGGSANTSFSTASSVISGSGGLTKTGTGLLTLGGAFNPAHTYAGTTTINGGAVLIGSAGLGTGNGNLHINGGVLEQYFGNTFSRSLGTGAGQIQITGGNSGFSGAGSTSSSFFISGLANNELVWGSAYFSPGVFTLQSAYVNLNGKGSMANNFDLNGAGRTIAVVGGDATGGFTLSGVIRTSSGTAGLTKTGVGQLILNGVNTYNGPTVINGGTLQVGNNTASSLGGGTYNADISIVSGTTLRIFSTAAQTLGGTISGGGNLVKAYAGNLTLSNSNTYTGKTSIAPQTTAGAGTVSVSSFNSVVGGTTSSSLGAPTTVANGTIDFGSTGAQGAAILKYTGPGETTDRVINFLFNGSGAAKTLDASGAGGLLKFTSTFTGSGSANNDVALTGSGNAEIAGGLPFGFLNFSKSGSGTWTLGGTVGHTGATSITGGKLVLGANNVFPNGTAVSIGNATLDATTFTDTVGTLDVTSTATINLGTGAALAFADSSAIDWTGGTLSITGTFVSGASLRFGTGNTGLTATQLAKLAGTGLSAFSLNGSGYLTANGGIGDNTPPTLASISDNKSGGPVVVNTLVTYTVTFSEDMDATTVTAADFGNAGTSSVTIGTITETTPGVFIIGATPTTAGTLQLKVNAAAVLADTPGNELLTTSALTDDTVLTVTAPDPYVIWSGGAAFDADTNGDGVDNGIAWLLGAADSAENATDQLPKVSINAGNLRLTFRCLNSTKRGGAIPKVQSSSDLGQADLWSNHEASVPDANATVNGVIFTITPEGGDFINVVAEIPAPDARIFTRLMLVSAP